MLIFQCGETGRERGKDNLNNTGKREKLISALQKQKSKVLFSLKFAIVFLYANLRFRKREKHGILLLRNDALGDFMVSIPLMMQIHATAKKYGSSVTVVVSENMLDFARRCPFIDNIIAIPPRQRMGNFFTRIATYCKFSGIQAETVINLMVFGRCGIEDYISYFIKAKRKLVLENLNVFPVFSEIAEFRKRTKFIYSEILEYNPEKTLQENETALASAALSENFLSIPGNLDFLNPLPPSPLPNIDNYYLVIAGSANPHRNWEAEKFASIINSIAEFYPDLRAVMTGSANDMEINRSVTGHCNSGESIIDLCGRTALMQLIALIKNAQFIITNETGPLHIAALLSKKVFSITGLGHWKIYVPNPLYDTVIYIHAKCDSARCNWICRKETNPDIYPCIREIETEMLWNAVRTYLSDDKSNREKRM